MASVKAILVNNEPYFISFEHSEAPEGNPEDSFLQSTAVVRLTDGVTVWRGELNNSDIDQFAIDTHKDATSTRKLCHQALAGCSSGSFVYDCVKDGATLQLKVKQTIANNIKFQFCYMSLEKESNSQSAVASLIESLINQLATCKEHLSQVQDTNHQLFEERNKAVKKVEELVVAKESLENELYGKFVAVLNEKKSQIRDLTHQVEKAKSSPVPREENESGIQQKIQHDNSSSGNDHLRPHCAHVPVPFQLHIANLVIGCDRELVRAVREISFHLISTQPPAGSDDATDEEKNQDVSDDDVPSKRTKKATNSASLLLSTLQPDELQQPPTLKRSKPRRVRTKQSTSSTMPRTASLPRPSRQESVKATVEKKSSTVGRRTSSRNSNTPSLDLDALMDQL